ncbi:MAG: class I SAM-dependent methyltransferase, partial [Dehalococcoidia bacterium]|nr:class I SAM-dependent methyltransferase [Dehalococcoidia bacterium]
MDMMCPVCGANEKERLLTVERAPVSCGTLFPSMEAAARAGECRLEITVCTGCGHIWNDAHSPTQAVQYDENYYSSFAASTQGRGYQMGLAHDLDRWVRVSGKTVLEIGCGDGFFLNELSSLGARAIGFEPSSTFEVAAARPGIEVLHRYFDFDEPLSDGTTVDVVVMRHVLEHLSQPGPTMRSLAAGALGPPDSRFLYIEVPNALQLLKDSLYFDFYSDHIQYFSPGSLNHLLRAAGWLPLAQIGNREEFLGLVCVNAESRSREHPASNGPGLLGVRDTVIQAANGFRQQFDGWRKQLATTVTGFKEKGSRVAVWGAGARGVSLLTSLGLPGETYEYVVDSDPNKHGK